MKEFLTLISVLMNYKMRFAFFVLAFLFAGFIPYGDFKTSQLKNSRVKTAFTEKENTLLNTLKSKNIQVTQLQIFLRIFKQEKLIEVWAKNKNDKTYLLLRSFNICASSGR